MIVTSPVNQCDICLTTAGFEPPASMQNCPPPGMSIFVPDTADPNIVASLRAYLATAAPCPHVFVSPAQLAASNTWAALNAQLAAIPGAPNPPAEDVYAAIRTRLTSELASALTAADAVGGLA